MSASPYLHLGDLELARAVEAGDPEGTAGGAPALSSGRHRAGQADLLADGPSRAPLPRGSAASRRSPGSCSTCWTGSPATTRRREASQAGADRHPARGRRPVATGSPATCSARPGGPPGHGHRGRRAWNKARSCGSGPTRPATSSSAARRPTAIWSPSRPWPAPPDRSASGSPAPSGPGWRRCSSTPPRPAWKTRSTPGGYRFLLGSDPSEEAVRAVERLAPAVDHLLATRWPDWYDEHLSRPRQHTRRALPLEEVSEAAELSVRRRS